MPIKDVAIKTLQRLPDSATWDDIEERLRFLAAMHKGLAAVQTPHPASHDSRNESHPR